MWQRAGLTETSVEKLDGVDGVGAGTVEDLLAAGRAWGDDNNRNRRILRQSARGTGGRSNSRRGTGGRRGRGNGEGGIRR